MISCCASSSGESWLCVVVAGCITRLFTSATLARSEKIFKLSINLCASFCPPWISKVKMDAPPFGKYFSYRVWSGWQAKTGNLPFLPADVLIKSPRPFSYFPRVFQDVRKEFLFPAIRGKSQTGKSLRPYRGAKSHERSAVPTDKFRRGMYDDICAVFNRTKKIGRSKGVIHHKRQTVLMRECCQSVDIGNIAVRIAMGQFNNIAQRNGKLPVFYYV